MKNKVMNAKHFIEDQEEFNANFYIVYFKLSKTEIKKSLPFLQTL